MRRIPARTIAMRRGQATVLLRHLDSTDPDVALAAARRVLSVLTRGGVTPDHARHVVATEHGFSSWHEMLWAGREKDGYPPWRSR